MFIPTRPRFRSNAVWTMNNAVADRIRQLDTAGGANLWAANLTIRSAAVPATLTDGRMGADLFGKGVYEASQQSGTLTTGQKIPVVGDYSRAYKIPVEVGHHEGVRVRCREQRRRAGDDAERFVRARAECKLRGFEHVFAVLEQPRHLALEGAQSCPISIEKSTNARAISVETSGWARVGLASVTAAASAWNVAVMSAELTPRHSSTPITSTFEIAR
jgi:hypothetical protein